MYPDIVLTNYPLSKVFRDRIEAHLGGTPRYVNVTDLRQVSLWRLATGLLALRAPRVLVAAEDESTRAVLPVLRLLAALVRSPRLCTVDGVLVETQFGRLTALASAFGVLIESGKALLAVGLTRREAGRLARLPRAEHAVQRYAHAAYLNCNLYFGVKAGGSVGHISGVANALMDLGMSLDFFSVVGRLLVDERARYVALRPPATLAIPFEATHYRFDRGLDREILHALGGSRPDFIYQRMSGGNYAGVRLSRTLKIPLVLEYNGSEAWIAKNWGRPLRFHDLAVLVEDVCLRHADVVVTVSEVLGDELVSRGVERGRVVVYPNCIDPRMFDPALFPEADRLLLKRELGFEPGDLLATFIGTFGQWHGVDVLAQAIRRVIDEHRELLERWRLRFVLVGDGPKMSIVRELLADEDSARYVRLTGLVPQVQAPRYLAASDILLSPHVANQDGSAFFGSPTKLFEYMAMGKAIVASDLDQIGQVLRPAIAVSGAADAAVPAVTSELAVLVPPGDVAALIEGIRVCCENPALRLRLGGNARSVALATYTWRHHTQAILDRLLAVRPPAAADRGS